MLERARLAREVLSHAQTVVIKIGTNVLADGSGCIDRTIVRALVEEMAELLRAQRRVVLVTSGAVAAGLERLQLLKRPVELSQIQACAAVGQALLMGHYDSAFTAFRVPTAQLLLTRADFDDRKRYVSIRSTLDAIHALGALAIVNENDTVATEEIKFGDNDVLASLVANLIKADACLFLTTNEGLLDDQGQVVRVVHDVANVLGLVKQSKSKLGSGGMSSKLKWASAVCHAGDVAVIANGRRPRVIRDCLSGLEVGTLLVPKRGLGKTGKLSSRARWIGLAARPEGTVQVDPGAAAAIRRGDSSLLPVGVRAILGQFSAGSVVRVVDEHGRECARGLIAYDSTVARQLIGLKKSDIVRLIGPSARQELIHRDNLVMTSEIGTHNP